PVGGCGDGDWTASVTLPRAGASDNGKTGVFNGPVVERARIPPSRLLVGRICNPSSWLLLGRRGRIANPCYQRSPARQEPRPPDRPVRREGGRDSPHRAGPRSHSLIASSPPEARLLPSGLNATVITGVWCPLSEVRSLPVVTSHSLTVLS